MAVTVPAVPARAAPADWSSTAERTNLGGFRIGNPKARNRVQMIVMHHCPFCHIQFEQMEDDAPLWAAISQGKLSLELDFYAGYNVDVAAFALMTCAEKPIDAFRFYREFEKNFDDRYRNVGDSEDHARDWKTQLVSQQYLINLAYRMQLDRDLAKVGFPAGFIETCLNKDASMREAFDTDQLMIDRLPEVTGTPSYILNGKLQKSNRWDVVREGLFAVK